MASRLTGCLLLSCLLTLLWPVHVKSASVNDCPSRLPRDSHLRVHGDSCYVFVVDRERVYQTAERECGSNGGRLATVRTFDEQKFIYQTLRHDLNFRGVVWIGLSDIRSHGTLQWGDGSAIHYLNWAQGQPALLSNGANCVLLNVTDDGKWTNAGCPTGAVSGATEHYYVCEYPVIDKYSTASAPPAGARVQSTTRNMASATSSSLTSQPASAVGLSPGGLTVWVHETDSKVQVFHDGQWTSICADHWDNPDAEVICRMQGYWHGQGAAELRQITPTDVIMLNDVECTGNESNIAQCHYDGFRSQTCGIGAVGAVSCQPKGAVQVRLVDGFGPWEGRLEVEGSPGVWSPVCRTGFDDLDAQVVCRMLGIRTQGGKAHTEEKFNQSSLSPLIHQMDCAGNEADIAHCKGREASEGESCRNAGVECYSCGGLYTSSSGVVQSENYPHSYPGNQNCLYIIRPANQQVAYKLKFSNFSTEECCDTLEVKVLTDASNLPSGGTVYSGTRGPPSTYLGQAFALSFLTDGSHSLQGFQATWSEVSVADAVSITCQAGRFTLDVDLAFLRRLYPQSDPASIALADPSCRGTVERSVNGEDRLVITSDVDSCGTKVVTGTSTMEYHNFLVDRVFATGSNLIVRDRRWTLPFRCSLDRTDHFELHYIPVPDLRRRSAQAASVISPEVVGLSPEVVIPSPEVVELSAEDDFAHAREAREVRGSLSVNLNFPTTLTVFTDRSYTQVDAPPLLRRLGDDIDFRLQMSGGDLDLTMVLQNCYAKPELASNVTYYLIQNGCVVDSTTEILHRRQHTTDFRFNAFEFAGNFPRMYVMCDVIVCPDSNTNYDARCSQTCVTPSSSLVG